MRWFMVCFCLAATPLGAQTIEPAEPFVQDPRAVETAADFRQWVSSFRSQALAAGVSAATYDREMRQAVFLPDVVQRDRNQNEFTKTIWNYLDTAVSDQRIEMGQAALKTHARLLAQIEARYGLPKELVLAVWGMETAYGSYRGTTDTISALATLSYDGRRASYFGQELIAALKILEAGHVSRARMLGSWAGAMGHSQFMPTSWEKWAVDFDGDGKRDIWSEDPTDALASAAAYLAQNGWQTGAIWGLEVTLPASFDYAQSSVGVEKSAAQWQALGIRPVQADAALPAGARTSVLLPAGASGAAFLIYPNFQVIETYNPADAYVIGIGHLADRIAGGPAIQASWPRHWQALTLAERKELQTLLTSAGHDTKGIDGRLGPRSVASVQAWQKAQGLLADGYASPDVLAALRAQAAGRAD